MTSGQTATFAVAADGTAPLAYQWQKNGVDIVGATEASYTTPATTVTDNGALFRCRVTNGAGSVTSSSATLTVTGGGGGGDNVVQNAGFESGTSDWRFYTNATGSFTVAGPGDGSANAAVVTTTTVGSNIQLYQPGVSLQPNTAYRLTFSAFSNTGRDLRVSVQKHGSPYTNYGLNRAIADLGTGWQTFTFDFTTTGFSTPVTDARLMFWFASDAAPGDLFRIDNVSLTTAGASTPVAPSITSGPSDQSVTSGQTATFAVTADGTAPLTYQWQKNGVDIAGATGASYTTPATTLADNGALFRCRVTNGAGSVTSSSATLTVTEGEPGGAWWDDQWRYRVPIFVNAAGFARSDKPVETDINFTSLLSALGATGNFNESSIRVVEVASDGSIINSAVPFQFDKDAAYNATSNARGSLVFMMAGTTGPSVSRQFHVYFETANGFSAAPVTPQVTVADNVSHEGQTSFQISTASGTWYYHKQGAGFASLDDVQGNDWIGYRVGGGSAGEFRGIPNLGAVAHPGYTNASTSLLRSGPLRATLLSRSNDNAWEMTWDLYPGYATLTILKAGAPYWLLYEGTPGGALNLDSDTMTLSSGYSQTLRSDWNGEIPSPEWAYFRDGPTGRYLYFIHHEDDSAGDQYWSMEGNMTVFGLGRQYKCCGKYLTATPARLTVGLGENGTAPQTTIDSAFRPVAVTVSAPETSRRLPGGTVLHPDDHGLRTGQCASHPGSGDLRMWRVGHVDRRTGVSGRVHWLGRGAQWYRQSGGADAASRHRGDGRLRCRCRHDAAGD